MPRRALLLATFLLAAPASAQSFSFVALGDTTYAIPADNPLYERLIQAINASEPAFSIHVGDTKGRGDCGRASIATTPPRGAATPSSSSCPRAATRR